MKAVRLLREGGPEQLVYEDAPKPQLGAGDASSEFTPRALRLATGLSVCPRYWDNVGRRRQRGGRRDRCVNRRRGVCAHLFFVEMVPPRNMSRCTPPT